MIAIVSGLPLSGALQGDRLRLGSLVKGAHQADPSATLLTLSPHPKSASLAGIADLLHGEAPYMAWHRHHWSKPSLDQPVDILCAFQLRVAPQSLTISAKYRILDLTDSLGLYRHNLGGVPEARKKRWMLQGIRRSEVQWGRLFNEVWVSTARDQDWLHKAGLMTRVMENAVPQKKVLPPGDPYHLLFVGNLEYLPNRVGMTRFLSQVWPVLARNQYQLTVVGKGSEHLKEPGVTGCGYVLSVEPYYLDAGIVISPVPLGSGSQNKILEAMGFGRPVVAATEALAGLTPVQRAAVLPAAVAADWPKQLASLHDWQLYHRIVESGFRAVPMAGDTVAARFLELLGTL